MYDYTLLGSIYIISAWGLGLLVQQGRAISGPQFEERVTEHDPRFFYIYTTMCLLFDNILLAPLFRGQRVGDCSPNGNGMKLIAPPYDKYDGVYPQFR